jgi:hypothetical protein
MRLADDGSTLFGFPLVVQVWATVMNRAAGVE